MVEYKIGMRVKIKRDSEFYGQSHSIGTITYRKENGWYRVLFDNKYEDSYRSIDLDLAEPRDNEEAILLLPKFEEDYLCVSLIQVI